MHIDNSPVQASLVKHIVSQISTLDLVRSDIDLSAIIEELWLKLDIELKILILDHLNDDEKIIELAQHLQPKDIETLIRLLRRMEVRREWMGRSDRLEKSIQNTLAQI